MRPTFLLFHAESVNEEQNSICHLIFVPVIEGTIQSPIEFFINPEAPYHWVMSGITSKQVQTFPILVEMWPEIQRVFNNFDMAVCTAEGYSARALYGTLSRLGIDFNQIDYCNAKAICRRLMNEVSYSFDYLCYKLYNDCIHNDRPVDIAVRWCDIVVKALGEIEDCNSIADFLSQSKIRLGSFKPGQFVPSHCLKDYSTRKNRTFDPAAVSVDAQPDHQLFGMNVVFTGKMESMTRNDARSAVVRIGGHAPENLTMDTDYLVVGVQDLRVVGEKGLSGKMKTAAKYREKGCPIEIIDESDFIEMLGESNIPKKKEKEKQILPCMTIDLSKFTDEQFEKATEALERFRKEMGYE